MLKFKYNLDTFKRAYKIMHKVYIILDHKFHVFLEMNIESLVRNTYLESVSLWDLIVWLVYNDDDVTSNYTVCDYKAGVPFHIFKI